MISAGARAVVRRVRKPVDAVTGPLLGSIISVASPDPILVLTFDDGPAPGVTEGLAQLVVDAGGSAVFFVLLTRARQEPGLLRDLAAAGHEIALHGLDHRRLPTLTRSAAQLWLQDGKAELEDLIGQEVRWFRPPHGAQNPRTRLQAQRAGLTTVLWSGTTWDWKDVSEADRMTKALADSRPGAILLAHDGTADATDLAAEPKPPEVDKFALLSALLDAWSERGLRTVTLSGALKTGMPVRRLSFSD